MPSSCSVAQWKASLEQGKFGTKVLYAKKLTCTCDGEGSDGPYALEVQPLEDGALLPQPPAAILVSGPKTILAMLELLLRKRVGKPTLRSRRSERERRMVRVAPQDGAAPPRARQQSVPSNVPLPDMSPKGNIELDIKLMVSQLTMQEKFAQMLQLERKECHGIELSKLVRNMAIGSLLSGGGSAPEPNTPWNWADMVDSFQQAALASRVKIPVIYGNDSVHGQANARGAVLFPHNIGLGCSGDPELALRCAEITAVESRATGVHWIFAPALSVAQDVRWGRTYEGFSDDFDLVGAMGAAAVRGYQSNHTVACIKHWVGDGSTTFGTGKGDVKVLDCGDCRASLETLRKTHIRPYLPCLEAGCQTVMASFSSVNGEKMHGHHRLLTGVLKEELGFDGILVSDWAAVDELAERFLDALVKAINAGIDVVMLPGIVSWGNQSYKSYFNCMRAAVDKGLIPMTRIDDAVARILRVKARMGLFQDPWAHRDKLTSVGCWEHREVAREAVRRSLVLLKNEAGALPLQPSTDVLVAGEGAHDLGMQCGGWSIEHQGFAGNGATRGTTILAALREQGAKVTWDPTGRSFDGDVALVVCGERPYAETEGDARNFAALFPRSEYERIFQMQVARPDRKVVLVLLCGRPLPLSEDLLSRVDAVLVAWLPGTEGMGVVDVLCGQTPTGKLSVNWPSPMLDEYQFERGFGLTW